MFPANQSRKGKQPAMWIVSSFSWPPRNFSNLPPPRPPLQRSPCSQQPHCRGVSPLGCSPPHPLQAARASRGPLRPGGRRRAMGGLDLRPDVCVSVSVTRVLSRAAHPWGRNRGTNQEFGGGRAANWPALNLASGSLAPQGYSVGDQKGQRLTAEIRGWGETI